MTPAFPNASQSFLDLNPHLANPRVSSQRPSHEGGARDAVRPELEQRPPVGAVRPKRAKGQNPDRFLVRVTSVRSRLIDFDNLCVKYVVDCCRYAGLLPGDGPGQTQIESCQRKAGKEEAEHTIVEIFTVNDSITIAEAGE